MARSSDPAQKIQSKEASYLLRLEVENVRCFGPRQVLDLSDGHGRPARWTVILGENGVGKTTLLQCLVALETRRHFLRNSSSSTAPQVELPIPSSEWEIYRDPHWPEATSIVGEVALGAPLSASKDTYLAAPVATPLGKDFPQAEMRRRMRSLWHSAVARNIAAGVTSPSPGLEELRCFAYGAARRSSGAGAKSELANDPAASLFSDSADLRDAESWLLSADHADLRAAGKPGPRLQRLETTLTKLLPGVEGFEIKEGSESDPYGYPSLSIRARTPYGSVPLSQLSLGYRTMVAWTVDLASRLFRQYPESENPLHEPAVVLVDEIDLHLHPRWQRQLLTHLSSRFPNAQFIVTAHSPLVVQAAESQNLALLRQEGDHVVIDNEVEHIRGWRIDQILTSDLFGLESARPQAYDSMLEERTALRARRFGNSPLSGVEEERLAELDAIIEDFPAGERPEDVSAMEIIRKAAEILQGSK